VSRGDRYGLLCRIAYRPCPGVRVSAGDYLRSSGGSVYEVLDARDSPSYPDRQNLKCVHVDPDEVPASGIVHSLYWDRRAAQRI